MGRRNQVSALLLACICATTAAADDAVNLEAIKKQLLAGSLDVAGLPAGFSAARPTESEVDAQRRAQGAVWAVAIKLAGPARLPKDAKISGNTDNLKIDGKVTLTAYHDVTAAEESCIRLVKELDPNVEFGSRTGIRGFLRCKFSAIQTNCVLIHDRLPIIVETKTDNWVGAAMEHEELARLRDDLDSPLMTNAQRYLTDAAPAVAKIAPAPSAAKAPGGTVWGLFSSLAGKTNSPTPDAKEAWQNSWDAFAHEVQTMFSRHATREEFTQRFNGKRVVWAGKLAGMQPSSPGYVRANFVMPPYVVRLPDGGEYSLSQLTLTLPATKLAAGDRAEPFRAVLANGTTPAISADILPGANNRVITVSLAEAELIP